MTDLESIRRALDCIPSNLTRDEWARVGMALKSELGEAGFELFEAWSARADGYKASDCRSTWQSINAGGGVGIGSLFHLAKLHGYEPDKTAVSRQPNADEQRERAAQRKARDDAANAARERAHEAAAVEAARMWESASDATESPYLLRKKTKGVGVRVMPDGMLLVPLRDANGRLWNLQRIAPQKPAQGTDKLFLKGGRKSGLFHLAGEPTNAPALLVCEGAATGFSLHEATGLPTVIAFDAGNLIHVCKALHAAHLRAVMLVCGDDDGLQHADNKNPGHDGAVNAANAIGARWVLPNREHLPKYGSDFNDAHVHAGIEAVKTTIENALKATTTTTEDRVGKPANATTRKPQRREVPAARDSTHNAPTDDQKGSATVGAASNAPAPDMFVLCDEGVYFMGLDRNGNPSTLWVCSRLEVRAKTRDTSGDAWGFLLGFTNHDGAQREWVLPARLLAGDGNEYRSALMGMGLCIGHTTAAKQALTRYIQTRDTDARARTVDRLGWHNGRQYVLPRATIGEGNERVIFLSEGATESHFSQQGTLLKWHEEIGRFCPGNYRLIFAASAAFAGIMLRPSGLDSGGFHFVGDSSSGKTTALRVACSVLGSTEYMKRWRATDNGLESLAVQRCDALMVLDELAQLDARVAGEAAYLLANETAKIRSTKGGAPRPSPTWKTLILSAGEVGLAAHMAEANKRPRAGQEIRLIDLPADAGAGVGVFNVLHGETDGAALSNRLVHACSRVYGAPGRDFLEWAVSHADELPNRLRNRIDELVAEWVPPNASGQVSRAAHRFALVAASGELAVKANAVQWPLDEPARAAKALFDEFVKNRGGFENSEKYQMQRQLRAFFETHGSARFEDVSRVADDHAPKTMHRAGFRTIPKDDAETFYYLVSLEIFRGEIAQGYDYKAMLRMLKDAGFLKPDKGRPFDCKVRIPGLTGGVHLLSNLK